MNISVLTLKNPFSFFCHVENKGEKSSDFFIDERKLTIKPIKATHGQYVAVFWHNNWVRGIVNVETNVMIWLVDYGIHIRPDDDMVYVDLPGEYRKLPSKVFEASIHGVVPLEKIINEECQIENKISKTWNKGAVEKAQELIKNAIELFFDPIAILSTKYNDIVLGNLYIKLLNGEIINIIEDMEKWPCFLKKDPESYIKYLNSYYPQRKIHRAFMEKPKVGNTELPELLINDDSLHTYQTIVNSNNTNSAKQEIICKSTKALSEIGSTVIGTKTKEKPFRLTPQEVVHYSDMVITISGVEYNALQLFLNKIKDLEMCEMYQDAESVGRGITNRFLYRNNVHNR